MITQIILAWFYGHVLEYVLHKYILHNIKLKPVFKNHFGNHHRISRKTGFVDERYEKILSRDSFFEIGTLLALAIIHLPLFVYYPWAYATLIWSVIVYYFLHRKMHLDPAWARKWAPWHYEHHMGKDQHDWWGVRLPLVDLTVKLVAMSWNKLIKRHN